ncbi:MAG: DivIVA domain-containing protein [Xenococcus sp. MO_188.B8]|nr:DivIVA domain-containing protein [Xenococcus sp. MO_188.B8]
MLYQEESLNSAAKSTNNTELLPQEIASNSIDCTFDIQKQLDSLENCISEKAKIPFTDLIIINKSSVLESLKLLKANLPPALALANEILQQKQVIISKAEDYARNRVISAEKKAEKILQNSGIIRQAELEAARIQQDAEEECKRLLQSTQEEIGRLRELTAIEYEEIQKGADTYAINVLSNLEEQLVQMLEVTRNGRQQLEPSSESNK